MAVTFPALACGRRADVDTAKKNFTKFQPLLPVRGATGERDIVGLTDSILTLAPREGSDPTAPELADIAQKKAAAIRDIFQTGLMQADTAQKELKLLSDETGMFGSITDEEIAANTGKTYQDVTVLRDPLAGLGFNEEDNGAEMPEHPFDTAVQDAAFVDYSPNQPRDKNGRWTGGGSSDKIGKTKYAPSPQRRKTSIQLKPKTYARLTGTLNTRFPGLQAGEVRKIRDSNNEYIVKADGFGGFETISKRRI